MKARINTSRTLVYDTLASAMADTRPLGYQEVAVIKGDNTRFKRGDGTRYSAANPAGFIGNSFANLPWHNAAASFQAAFAVPATATLTAAQITQRYIKTTSAAATTITLPTATSLGTQLSALQGTELNFTLDNSKGANNVTIALNAGITQGVGALTGNQNLVIASGQVGKFLIFFLTATTAYLYRTL